MKKVTVPFFISHQGCPHTCVFCDQRIISGSGGVLPGGAEIAAKIRSWQTSTNGRPVEVAFFGGSFTALPRSLQQQLLSPVQPFLANGAVSAIRISTRPDYIDDESVQWLKGMGVAVIELGVQSMDDDVLLASGRGHSALASETAIRCLCNNGISAGAQLMPGLPGDTMAKSLDALDRVVSAGAGFIRIYPVVVIKGTELAARFLSGTYTPLTLEQGVTLCKRLLHKATLAGIDVIRIGLQSDEGLNAETVLGGCWHPALGQLVRSGMYYDLVLQLLSDVVAPISVEISCNPSRVSDIIGHERANIERLSRVGIDACRIISDPRLSSDELEIIWPNKRVSGSIAADLVYL